MDAATLQARINYGYGAAATRIGYTFTTYRPVSTINPLASGNAYGAPLNAAFTVNGSTYNFGKPGAYKDALWLGLFDRTATLVGDYLYNATHGTYFIAAQQDALPTLCVKCNNTVSIIRPSAPSAAGISSGYIGATPATETAIMTSWPASVLYEARGRKTTAELPLDEQNPFFTILMPALAGVDVRPNDILTDGNTPTRRYVIGSSERSSFGWRMLVQHWHA